jgi:hypothetical protein
MSAACCSNKLRLKWAWHLCHTYLTLAIAVLAKLVCSGTQRCATHINFLHVQLVKRRQPVIICKCHVWISDDAVVPSCNHDLQMKSTTNETFVNLYYNAPNSVCYGKPNTKTYPETNFSRQTIGEHIKRRRHISHTCEKASGIMKL